MARKPKTEPTPEPEILVTEPASNLGKAQADLELVKRAHRSTARAENAASTALAQAQSALRAHDEQGRKLRARPVPSPPPVPAATLRQRAEELRLQAEFLGAQPAPEDREAAARLHRDTRLARAEALVGEANALRGEAHRDYSATVRELLGEQLATHQASRPALVENERRAQARADAARAKLDDAHRHLNAARQIVELELAQGRQQERESARLDG